MNFSYPFIRRPVGTTLLAIGLFLVGAGTFPGSGLNAGSGYLVAQRLLRQ